MKPTRWKKLLALALFLPLMLIYFGIVVTIGDFLPNHWVIDLIYYLIMGVIWAFPLKPVLIWINRPPTPADRVEAPPQQAQM